jgi:hypothetical protein
MFMTYFPKPQCEDKRHYFDAFFNACLRTAHFSFLKNNWKFKYYETGIAFDKQFKGKLVPDWLQTNSFKHLPHYTQQAQSRIVDHYKAEKLLYGTGRPQLLTTATIR